MSDDKTKDAEFEERLAASEKRVAELEAQLAEGRKPPAPTFKPAPQERLDLTARAAMPKAVAREMAHPSAPNANIDDRLFAGLCEDAYPSLRQTKGKPSGVRIDQHEKAAPQDRSATPGYVDPRPMWPPVGVNVWPKQEEK
jgi:hypothetical protein